MLFYVIFHKYHKSKLYLYFYIVLNTHTKYHKNYQILVDESYFFTDKPKNEPNGNNFNLK